MSRGLALVTGAAQGIGAATAGALALLKGYHVVLTDIQDERGEAVAARIREQGGAAQYLTMDVRHTDSVAAAFARVEGEHGAALRVLINNAGYVNARTLDTLTDEAWGEVIDGNLTGMLRVVRAAAPAMRRARGGAIVCMSSIAGQVIGWSGRLAYSAAKAGIAGFVRSLALELAPDGIRVNGLAPGGLHCAAADVPLGRVGTPGDIANAVLLLTDETAGFITGQLITVDGGLTLQLRLTGESMTAPERRNPLTEVGPDTAMGRLLRQYWTPVLRSGALVADGAPLRVRLLGENYVAFRASDGRVGVLDEACPHRCASLVLARNEDCALRCIFHGWKIGLDGRVLDIPNEAPGRREALAAQVVVRKLPVREAGGLVWVLPDITSRAPFPHFEFNDLPPSQLHVRAGRVRCHWLQVMESVLDAAHIGYLHRDTVLRAMTANARVNASLWVEQASPELEIEETAYGFREAAIRPKANGRLSTRIREVVAPWHVLLPAEADSDRQVVITIPEDESHTKQFIVQFSSSRALTDREIEALWAGAGPDLDDFAARMPRGDTHWGQDREAMRDGHFSGFTQLQVFCEDFAILESMGPVTPRDKEHLTRADASVIFYRQQLLKSLRSFDSGGAPIGVDPMNVDHRAIRSYSGELEVGANWRELRACAR